jgi:glycosyltransferase involved in cell wall biosynthesis
MVAAFYVYMQAHLKPKVSVVLPFYNAEKTILQALQSISVQTLSDFECILVDNDSTDNSTDIALKYCQKDSRFKYIRENSRGVCFASVTGSKIANSDYIARMDADDIALPHRLEFSYQFLENNSDCEVVCGQVEFGGNRHTAAGIYRYVNWVNSLNNSNIIALRRFVESPVINPSAMWRKEIESRLGGYRNGDFPEDYEMWLRWMESEVKIGKINMPVLIWNDLSTRLTRTDRRYSTDAFYRLKSHYLANYLNQINPYFPHVLVWGASRLMRRRAELLKNYGIEIDAYIDITKKRQIGEPILYYQEIPKPNECFILVYVPQRIIRDRIIEFLTSKSYVEGKNFLLIA